MQHHQETTATKPLFWEPRDIDMARKIAGDPTLVTGRHGQVARCVGEEAERAERAHRTLCADSAPYLMRKALEWLDAPRPMPKYIVGTWVQPIGGGEPFPVRSIIALPSKERGAYAYTRAGIEGGIMECSLEAVPVEPELFRDRLITTTEVGLGFRDRLRVLVKGRLTVRSTIQTENEVGRTQTESASTYVHPIIEPRATQGEAEVHS